jgi:hypothetical protein
MVIPHTVPARYVQSGFFRDQQGKWEIVRVDPDRDNTVCFVLRQPPKRGRWRSGRMPADQLVTVYEKVSPER